MALPQAKLKFRYGTVKFAHYGLHLKSSGARPADYDYGGTCRQPPSQAEAKTFADSAFDSIADYCVAESS